MDKHILRSLTIAVRDGHLEKVRKIVHKCGFSDSCPWSEGYDLLYTSIEYQHTEIAKLLLTSGAKVNNEREKISNTPLHLAVTNDNIELVEILLDRGANIHAINEYHSTVLHDAVERGKMEITELLLHRGANVSAKNKQGFTPLHYAVRWYHTEIVKILLKNNACVNASAWCEITPLHIAAWKGYAEITKVLLNHGANTESICISTQSLNLDIPYTTPNHCKADSINLPHYFTALHIAIKERHETIVKLLLEHGADIDASDKDRRTALHFAANPLCRGLPCVHHDMYIRRKMTELLLNNGANINAKTKSGETPLHVAAKNDCLRIVEILLQHDADINANNEDGRTALHFTVGPPFQMFPPQIHNMYVKRKITELLLNKGANVNAEAKGGETPLHLACGSGYSEIVETLLQHHADIDISDTYGRTALHVTIYPPSEIFPYKHHDRDIKRKITDLLLSRGANVNVKTKGGETPLHLASLCGYQEIVAILLQHDADVNASDKGGRTALHFTIDTATGKYNSKNRNTFVKREITELLLSKGANVNAETENGTTPLHTAAKNDYLKIVEILLQHDANVDATDEGGRTALHYTVHLPQKYDSNNNNIFVKGKITELLLSKGANVDAKTKSGETPLHVAVKNGWSEIVEILLQHDADINASDNGGRTVLHFASNLSSRKSHYENHNIHIRGKMTEQLLSKGANVNAKSKNGEIPLHVAAKNDCLKIVEILLQHDADINASDNDGRTILHFAADSPFRWSHYENNNIHIRGKMTKLLLSKGANVNANTKNGETPLHVAAKNDYLKSVKILLKHGADINASNNGGRTVLHFAADPPFRGSHYEKSQYENHNLNIKRRMINLLLRKGANVNAKTKNGETPLHVAVKNNCSEIVEILLHHDADINAGRGKKTLYYAINKFATDKKIAKLLKRHEDEMKAAGSCVSGRTN